MSKPNILWLMSDWQANDYRADNNLYGGISYYRVIKPAEALKEWFDIEVVGAEILHWGTTDETYSRFKDYDLIISKHARTPLEASNTLASAKYFKKKVLFDIDDNYKALRDDNPAFKDYEYGQGPREFIGATLSLADGVIVSTAPLKQAYKELNKKIFVLPNCNDINDWPAKKVWGDDKVRIGFAGGQGHKKDLELILEPMAYILAKYPNVLFEIIGAVGVEDAMKMGAKMIEFCKKDITKQFRIQGGTEAWKGYPELLASFGWDIVVGPAVDDGFNRCKSHNRWMETAMIGCPLVASPVYPYKEKIFGTDTIVDEKTGLFAKDKEEWYAMLEGLILHPEARKEISTNAYEYIKDNWQYSQWADRWKKVIDKFI